MNSRTHDQTAPRALITLLALAISLPFDSTILGAEAPPSAVIPCVKQAPRVDGSLSDPAWRAAAEIALDAPAADGATSPPGVRSTARLLRTDSALYAGFRCAHPRSPDLQALDRPRDGPVFSDESVELFIDRRDGSPYYHFCVNARGSQYDGRGMNGSWNGVWTCKTKAEAGAWTAVIEIPFETLDGVPAPGTFWGLNACRNASLDGKVEYAAWSSPGHHHPNGLLFFGPVLTAPRLQALAASLDQAERMRFYLGAEDRASLAAGRSRIASLGARAGQAGLLAPAAYLEFSKDAASVEEATETVSSRAQLNLLFGEPPRDPRGLVWLVDGRIFEGNGWRISPNPAAACGLCCARLRGSNEEPLCAIALSVEGGSLEPLLAADDTPAACRYELHRAVRQGQDFYVGRRIKACGKGVWVDLVASEKSWVRVAIQGVGLAMGGAYRVGGERLAYPVLPKIKDKRQVDRHPLGGQRVLFQSSEDPAACYSLLATLNGKELFADTSINSDGLTASVVTGMDGTVPLSFFFSPTPWDGPVPEWAPVQEANPAWLRDAVRRSIGEAELVLGQWDRQVASIRRLLAGSAAVSALDGGMAGAVKAAETIAQAASGVRRGAPATLEDWASLGRATAGLRSSMDAVIKDQAFAILFGDRPRSSGSRR